MLVLIGVLRILPLVLLHVGLNVLIPLGVAVVLIGLHFVFVSADNLFLSVDDSD